MDAYAIVRVGIRTGKRALTVLYGFLSWIFGLLPEVEAESLETASYEGILASSQDTNLGEWAKGLAAMPKGDSKLAIDQTSYCAGPFCIRRTLVVFEAQKSSDPTINEGR
jgi:hypothetical protein